jgi:hypothetical protein
LRWCGKSLIRRTLSGQRWLACLKAERPRRGQQKWKPVLRPAAARTKARPAKVEVGFVAAARQMTEK